jgi:hypothetical protein
MQHHRVEYAEQIEVDHAKVRSLRLDIIRALFGFVFLKRSQLSLHRRTEAARKSCVARLYRHMFTEHRLPLSNHESLEGLVDVVFLQHFGELVGCRYNQH